MIKITKHTVHNLPKHPDELRKKTVGLGDAVAAVAQPTARLVDGILGTDFKNCKGCVGPDGRKERWNKQIPDILNPFKKK